MLLLELLRDGCALQSLRLCFHSFTLAIATQQLCRCSLIMICIVHASVPFRDLLETLGVIFEIYACHTYTSDHNQCNSAPTN